MNIKRNRYSIMIWEENRGIAFPIDNSIGLDQFNSEAREIALRDLRQVKFISLFYDPSFYRNYIPLRDFLSGRSPKIFQDDNRVKELYEFFFSHSIEIIHPDKKNIEVRYEFRDE